MDNRYFAAHYDAPVREPGAPRPEVRRPGPVAAGVARARRARRRRGGRRRLAWVDCHFPWRRSGFRWDEARAMLALRPDTLFFSTYAMDDPFPAPVHALADFPQVAVAEGVTDVYGVFLLFLEGLLGMGPAAA